MKKFIFFVLLCLSLCVLIVACDISDKAPNDATTEIPANEVYTKAPRDESKTNPQNDANDTVTRPIIVSPAETTFSDKDRKLISEISAYMKEMYVIYEPIITTFETNIDRIIQANQVLHISFEESEPYFMCAYFTETDHYESLDYCCLEKYIWVKYKKSTDIQEKFQGKDLVIAFQINDATSVFDIESAKTNVPEVSHYRHFYSLEFIDGYCTNEALNYKPSFVYTNFHSADTEAIFLSQHWYYYNYYIFNTTKINGEYYIYTEQYCIKDNERTDYNLTYDFGKYYDALMSIIQSEKFQKTDQHGRTHVYGAFDIYEFVETFSK